MSLNVDLDRPIDLICMGRVAVDLYAEQIHSRLADTQTMRKYLGGCAGNIAVGTARLGLQTAMFSCVGEDEMGDFLRETLQREKVNTELLYSTPNHLTALVLLGVRPPHHFPLMFYRQQCADMQLKPEHVNADFIARAKALLFTGTGISTPSMQETTRLTLLAAKNAGTRIIFDLDYRPVLWGLTASGDGETRFIASEDVSKEYQRFVPLCDLIVGTEEEICIAAGINEINLAIDSLQAYAKIPLVIKNGAAGCRIYFPDGDILQSKPFSVDVLNVLGAGDAFMSGLLRGLLRGSSWEAATTYANAAGALVVTRHGCAPAIPFWQELTYFIEQYDSNPLVWQHETLALMHSQFMLSQLCNSTQSCAIEDEKNIPILDIQTQSLKFIGISLSESHLHEKLLSRPSLFGVHVKLTYEECESQLKQLSLLSHICRQLERRLLIELQCSSFLSFSHEFIKCQRANIHPFAWQLTQSTLPDSINDLENLFNQSIIPIKYYLSDHTSEEFTRSPNFLGHIQNSTTLAKEVA